jgi:hypothetical protein
MQLGRFTNERGGRHVIVAGASVLALAMTACDARAPDSRVPDSAAGVIQARSEAEAQFNRFLSLSIITRPRTGWVFDSVFACEDLQMYKDSRWVADYRVLRVAQRNDSTTDATAVLTTVARLVDRTGNGDYVGTMRVAEDTGQWVMLRSPATRDKWMVCGDSREGFSPLLFGKDFKWSPAGASTERARSLADSVRRARGLAPMR